MLVESQAIYALVGVVVLVGVKVDIRIVNVLSNSFGTLEVSDALSLSRYIVI